MFILYDSVADHVVLMLMCSWWFVVVWVSPCIGVAEHFVNS